MISNWYLVAKEEEKYSSADYSVKIRKRYREIKIRETNKEATNKEETKKKEQERKAFEKDIEGK